MAEKLAVARVAHEGDDMPGRARTDREIILLNYLVLCYSTILLTH